ncbi:hypothetical protein ACF0H5_021174 [Mactra antiquata]
MSDLLRFKDKVAIVTGGCNGIGRGCVDVFLENGGKVAAFDINEELGLQMKTEGPGEILFVKCDTRNEENVKSGLTEVVNKFGRIDCLVNCAGLHPGSKNIDDMTVEEFEKILNLNLTSYFIMCKYTLPYIRQHTGSIINITSMSGVTGDPMCPSYCTSKAGIAGLTRALAIDEALNGVRVNAIAPAAVRTSLLDSVMKQQDDPQRFLDLNTSTTQLDKIGEPREIGLAALYLAVDATFTTGFELHCSGGSEIGYGVKGHELV